MIRGIIALLLLIASPVYAQTTYNPHTSNLDYISNNDAFEYRADYTGDEKTYEGWTFWNGSEANTGSLIWRIANNTYEGGYITHTIYSGNGGFLYSWDNRFGYFGATGLVQYNGIQVTFGGINVQYAP